MYYARTKENVSKEDWQLLVTHLNNVSKLAGEFASKFNNKEMGEVIGLAHDLGKYSDRFQKRLRGSKESVDHSTAGAKLMREKYGEHIGLILTYGILGHHGGLKNYYTSDKGSSVIERLANKDINIKNYLAYENEIKFPENIKMNIKNLQKDKMSFSLSFYIRMLFSCLVDADFLDTERFLDEEKARKRGVDVSVSSLKEIFFSKIEEMRKNAAKTELNKIRNEILNACINAAEIKPGMFTLTVPTGGGKTLSSAAFALKHAEKYELDRIIYVIPFTSIIEQNANVFREYLGKKVVLEHHSNIDYSEILDDENYDRSLQEERWRLASENWDYPFIVTTSVQFFESLFHYKTSKCRKLHNIAKSVIIVDEAQSIPVDYFKLCIEGLKELTRSYGSTVVLCTATQPYIDQFFKTENKPVEIISKPKELYLSCKRTDVHYIGEVSDSELSEKLLKNKSALCIVNTRKHAHQLYKLLSQDNNEGIYHLSTHMCPVDRTKTLNEIRKRLDEDKKCILVSTSLIEAGVDISFPNVYRSLIGIDSIAQAAGRCNREGTLVDEFGNKINGKVFVFESTEKYALPKGWMSYTASLGKEILERYKDPLSLDAIEEYFKHLFSRDPSVLDKKQIFEEYNNNIFHYEFKELSKKFAFIDSNTISIIVPINEKVENKVEKLKYIEHPYTIIRDLQKYMVNIYEYELNKLKEKSAVDLVQDGLYMLNDDSLYSEKEGLLVEEDSKYLNGFLNV